MSVAFVAYKSNGEGRFITLDGSGAVSQASGPQGWRTTWTHIVSGPFVEEDDAAEFLLYDEAGGTACYFRRDASGVPAATRSPFGVNGRYQLVVPLSFPIIGGNDVMWYDTVNRALVWHDFGAKNGDLGPWTHIVGGNFTGGTVENLLCYDVASGGAGVYSFTIDDALFPVGPKLSWRTTWTTIASGRFTGMALDDLFCYDAVNGEGLFLASDGAGNFTETRSIPDMRGTWTHIVAGQFCSAELTDLLFYDAANGDAWVYVSDTQTFRRSAGWPQGVSLIAALPATPTRSPRQAPREFVAELRLTNHFDGSAIISVDLDGSSGNTIEWTFAPRDQVAFNLRLGLASPPWQVAATVRGGSTPGVFRATSSVALDRSRNVVDMVVGPNGIAVGASQVPWQHVLDYPTSNSPIRHVFILMLENRSYDHMLGSLALQGPDAVTGAPRTADGVLPHQSFTNSSGGTVYQVRSPVLESTSPPHEFSDAVEQMSSMTTLPNPFGHSFAKVDNGGFVQNYARHLQAHPQGPPGSPVMDPGNVMSSCTADQIPVLAQLAASFAVCDRWFSPAPGPTLPNRLLAMTGSSSGVDDSPVREVLSTIFHAAFSGYDLPNGTIFDRLTASGLCWAIYQDSVGSLVGCFPIASTLKGISATGASSVKKFISDVKDPNYPHHFTWIEPSYGANFNGGSSQHPPDSLAQGERLIADVYEAIRSNQAVWESSVLIITYDEHGGFYDHVPPPAAPPPGDASYGNTTRAGSFTDYSRHGFDFGWYGPRVPAIVVSPRIPAGTVDHRVYDHTSVLKTVADIFQTQPLTSRDAQALSLAEFATTGPLRTDCPTKLNRPSKARPPVAPPIIRDAPLPPDGMLDLFLQLALKAEIDRADQAPPQSGQRRSGRDAAVAAYDAVTTVGEAMDYLQRVAQEAVVH